MDCPGHCPAAQDGLECVAAMGGCVEATMGVALELASSHPQAQAAFLLIAIVFRASWVQLGFQSLGLSPPHR